MTEQDKMREAFENAMRGSGLPLDRAGDGYYGVTDAAWIGYQAALSTQQDAWERVKVLEDGLYDLLKHIDSGQGAMLPDTHPINVAWALLSPTNKDVNHD